MTYQTRTTKTTDEGSLSNLGLSCVWLLSICITILINLFAQCFPFQLFSFDSLCPVVEASERFNFGGAHFLVSSTTGSFSSDAIRSGLTVSDLRVLSICCFAAQLLEYDESC